MGLWKIQQGCSQDARVARPQGEHSGQYPHHGRQMARQQRTRRTHAGTLRILCRGQGLCRLHDPFQVPPCRGILGVASKGRPEVLHHRTNGRPRREIRHIGGFPDKSLRKQIWQSVSRGNEARANLRLGQ